MAAHEPTDHRVRLAIALGPAEAPRPKPEQPFFVQATKRRSRPVPVPTDLPAGSRFKKLTSAGTLMWAYVTSMVGGQHGFQPVLVIADGGKITVAGSKARSSSSTPDQHPA